MAERPGTRKRPRPAHNVPLSGSANHSSHNYFQSGDSREIVHTSDIQKEYEDYQNKHPGVSINRNEFFRKTIDTMDHNQYKLIDDSRGSNHGKVYSSETAKDFKKFYPLESEINKKIEKNYGKKPNKQSESKILNEHKLKIGKYKKHKGVMSESDIAHEYKPKSKSIVGSESSVNHKKGTIHPYGQQPARLADFSKQQKYNHLFHPVHGPIVHNESGITMNRGGEGGKESTKKFLPSQREGHRYPKKHIPYGNVKPLHHQSYSNHQEGHHLTQHHPLQQTTNHPSLYQHYYPNGVGQKKTHPSSSVKQPSIPSRHNTGSTSKVDSSLGPQHEKGHQYYHHNNSTPSSSSASSLNESRPMTFHGQVKVHHGSEGKETFTEDHEWKSQKDWKDELEKHFGPRPKTDEEKMKESLGSIKYYEESGIEDVDKKLPVNRPSDYHPDELEGGYDEEAERAKKKWSDDYEKQHQETHKQFYEEQEKKKEFKENQRLQEQHKKAKIKPGGTGFGVTKVLHGTQHSGQGAQTSGPSGTAIVFGADALLNNDSSKSHNFDTPEGGDKSVSEQFSEINKGAWHDLTHPTFGKKGKSKEELQKELVTEGKIPDLKAKPLSTNDVSKVGVGKGNSAIVGGGGVDSTGRKAHNYSTNSLPPPVEVNPNFVNTSFAHKKKLPPKPGSQPGLTDKTPEPVSQTSESLNFVENDRFLEDAPLGDEAPSFGDYDSWESIHAGNEPYKHTVNDVNTPITNDSVDINIPDVQQQHPDNIKPIQDRPSEEFLAPGRPHRPHNPHRPQSNEQQEIDKPGRPHNTLHRPHNEEQPSQQGVGGVGGGGGGEASMIEENNDNTVMNQVGISSSNGYQGLHPVQQYKRSFGRATQAAMRRYDPYNRMSLMTHITSTLDGPQVRAGRYSKVLQ